jgi:RNA polymerase sigma-70 factor (ECF subfamily)
MAAHQISFDPEIWVDQHGDSLYRYALLRLRDPSVAEEMVQETFLAALQSREKFAGRSSERTWLIGILKHKIIDHFRRISRHAGAEQLELHAPELEELFQSSGEWVGHWDFEQGPIEWQTNPAALLEQSEFQQTLQHCLGELPPRLANAFTLREMEELSSEEVCKVLEISTTNLWVMLHRARAHLRHCIEINWFRPA